MTVSVREMHPDEVHLVADYFHAATPEHLETLGVDPTRLPSPSSWTFTADRDRGAGIGSACVPLTVQLYLERLHLKRVFCEPNAFNVAPNRTLAACGFRYVKTHRTVPGPLNYHQAVTRWVFE